MRLIESIASFARTSASFPSLLLSSRTLISNNTSSTRLLGMKPTTAITAQLNGIPKLASHPNDCDISNPRPSTPMDYIFAMAESLGSTSYLSRMLQDGRISQIDYDHLRALLKQERHQHEEHVPGNVTLHAVFKRADLESASRVFNTPESLEHLLVHVPATDLQLRTQLVRKEFRHAIEASPNIRRRMFLEPDNRPGLQPALMPYKIARWFGSEHRSYMQSFWLQFTCDSVANGSMRQKWPILRRFFLTQPPCEQIALDVDCTTIERRRDRVVTASGGSTVGTILDAVDDLSAEQQWWEKGRALGHEVLQFNIHIWGRSPSASRVE